MFQSGTDAQRAPGGLQELLDVHILLLTGGWDRPYSSKGRGPRRAADGQPEDSVLKHATRHGGMEADHIQHGRPWLCPPEGLGSSVPPRALAHRCPVAPTSVPLGRPLLL